MRTLNLGILAHVDAGKTSLTERLLYTAGVIDEIGSVDDGSTQTDSMSLERQRGITIKSAVVSFSIGDTTVNLIDTPGHPDFIAEVERVLSVLDGAVLVISAVEGVQSQTRVLMRALRRLGIPVLLFVNKIDRGDADPRRVLHDITEKLTPAVIELGEVRHAGTRAARFLPYPPADGAFISRLTELLAEHDEAILTAYVHGTPVPGERLRGRLAALARRGVVYPVLFGSAVSGAGTGELNAAITEFLPTSSGRPDAPVDGAVFKIERGPAGDKVAYVRLFAGTLRTRDRVRFGAGTEAKVTAVSSADGEYGQARAGQIARVWGLRGTRIGDRIRAADGEPDGGEQTAHYFAPPTLETAVVPDRRADRPALHAALTRLAEQDPLINLRQGDQEIFISLYGEVQKEVIQATLADDFGIGVTFRETTTICVERPEGAGEAVRRMRAETNPFLAGVGLRIEPAPETDDVEFRLGVELGAMPLAFFKTVEESALQTLRQGIYGWQVTGCLVTMTHSGYAPPSSTCADFRGLTPLVVMEALSRAGTAVFEPLHRFLLDIPAERSVVTLQALPRLDAVPLDAVTRGSSCFIEGEIPAARVRGLERELPALTSGEGVLETAFERYRRVRGKAPARSRTGPNPLGREDYPLRVTRRV